jgi:hypothetical protein
VEEKLNKKDIERMKKMSVRDIIFDAALFRKAKVIKKENGFVLSFNVTDDDIHAFDDIKLDK